MKEQYIKEIATRVELTIKYVKVILGLFEEKATVPFIARYRKEITGDPGEVKIKDILDLSIFFKDLEKRKETIREQIIKLDKFTPSIEKKLNSIMDKNILEDFYLPYKPKKRNKATEAKELGLEKIAFKVLNQERFRNKDLEIYFNDKELKTIEDVEKYISYIIIEELSLNSELITNLKSLYLKHGLILSKLKRGKREEDAQKFKDYINFSEPIKSMPSHRYLAINRAEREGLFSISIDIDDEFILMNLKRFLKKRDGVYSSLLSYSLSEAYKKLHSKMVTFYKNFLKERSDLEAIEVFKKNLSDLLLAPPLLGHNILGVDPGYRTGSKVVVINKQGEYQEYSQIFPTMPNRSDEAKRVIRNFIKRYDITAIALGNGTASRENAIFLKDIIKDDKNIIFSVVNEAGASIYSASDEARREFPDLDLTVRGAISIARRLADPLSELVKIESKSIGVGQYQHDVNQTKLSNSLDFTVSSIVNRIGVDLNSTSASLLSYVSGLSYKIGENIVNYRDQLPNGFKTRAELKKVKGIGAKSFQQSIGFLVIRDGKNYLDSTRVHPESYDVAKSILKKLNMNINDFFKLSQEEREEKLKIISITEVATEMNSDKFTVKDILDELSIPMRDPREKFEYATFSDDIKDIKDLYEGLILEGVVNNITNFGAFIDIGIHESGLVHISEIANRFVKDPHTVLSLGEVVKVKVLSIDFNRKRIALSIKQVE